MNDPIEAIVTDQKRVALCNDCNRPITLYRIRVTAPERCAGMLLWCIPTHTIDGSPCPGKSHREVQ